jgi:hypothetical protein
LKDLGFNEGSYLVGFNALVNKEIRVFNHNLLSDLTGGSLSFQSSSFKTLPDGRVIADSNYNFGDAFLRSDSVPFGEGVRNEWRMNKFEGIINWLGTDRTRYCPKGSSYAVFEEYRMHLLVSDMHKEIMELTSGDINNAAKLTALLLAGEFRSIPTMLQIAERATEKEIINFVAVLEKAQKMRLHIPDYLLLFETMENAS